ncbi:MAG: hypothetical protein Q8L29_02335 [archaeon]|nr:hypothetical protein [archaeon]
MKLSINKAEKIKRKKLQELISLNNIRKINNLGGINIIEERDNSFEGRCEDYVFTEVKNEPWSSTLTYSNAIILMPIEFLAQRDYNLIESPNDGDIVAYILKRINKIPFISHWGIFENGKVRSRFGCGNVYRHNLNMVPSEYGNEIIFFRKSTKQP